MTGRRGIRVLQRGRLPRQPLATLAVLLAGAVVLPAVVGFFWSAVGLGERTVAGAQGPAATAITVAVVLTPTVPRSPLAGAPPAPHLRPPRQAPLRQPLGRTGPIGPVATSTPRPEELAERLGRPSPTPQPALPPIPTRAALPPSATWTTYSDPAFGYSFSYPANWQVDKGMVWNWTPNVQVKRSGTPPEELKIEVTVLRELEPGGPYASLDDWFARRALFHPDTEYRDLREIRVDGRRALRWEAHGGLAPEGALVMAVAQGDRVYLLTAYPAHSHHRWVFERVVQSFRLLPGLPRTGGRK